MIRPTPSTSTLSDQGSRPETVNILIVQHSDRIELYCERQLRTRIIEVPPCDREREIDLERYVDACCGSWWGRLHWPGLLREVILPRPIKASEIRHRRHLWALSKAIERAGRIARGETGVRHG